MLKEKVFLFIVISFKDFEQQLGDYEKELKMLRVKLDSANNELECKSKKNIFFE
jgi:hypothetical protein